MMTQLHTIVKRNGTFLSLLGIIGLSLLLNLLSLGNALYTKILLTNTLDFSWTTDSIQRLIEGKIAGRDFIFTYGPLFQLVQSLPSLLFHYPSYVSPLISSVLLQIPLCLIIFYIAGFATKNRREQLLLTLFLEFVVGIVSFPDANNLIRILLPFVYAILYSRMELEKSPKVWQTLFLLLIPSVFGLYTFDLFVLCIFITVILEIIRWYLIYRNNLLQLCVSLFWKIGLIIFIELLVSLLVSNGLGYFSSSLDTLRSYQYIMNIPFSFLSNSGLLIYVIVLIVLQWIMYKKSSSSKSLKTNFLILTFVSLLQLKAVLIRSDEGHLLTAVYPSIIVTFILLFIILREKVTCTFFFLFCFLFLFLPYKTNYLSYLSVNTLRGLQKITNTNSDFFSLYKLPDTYYYTPQDFAYFSNFLSKNKGSVMVYPYDTYLLNMIQTTFNTYALQFYEYSNSPVEKISVDNLQKNPPRYIILGVDTKGAVVLDDIPNLTRNPRIAKWMFTNYEVYKITPTYLILLYSPKKTTVTPGNLCSLFSLNIANSTKSNLLEKIGKSSTFYLDEKDKHIRLPYSLSNSEMFIVNGDTDAHSLETLFNQSWNFAKHTKKEIKDVVITKKYPLPQITKVYSGSISVDCYN